METIGLRIKAARKAAKMTQPALSVACGWGAGNSRISNYELDQREPKSGDIEIIARATRTSRAWLSTGEGSMAPGGGAAGDASDLTKQKSNKSHDNLSPVELLAHGLAPVISWVSAGLFCESPDLFNPGDAEEWVEKPKGSSEFSFALRVEGVSMVSPYPGQKSYPPGCIIVVDPERVLENGARVVARDPETNKTTFKVYVEDGGRRYLKPLNPQYDSVEIKGELQLCGVVTRKIENE